MNIAYIWLLVGTALVIFDAVHLGGVGLIFIGLGAITTGAALELSFIAADATIAHWLVFCVATAAWTAILWKPIQKFRTHKHGGYNDMIGQTAYVGSNGLSKNRGGEVTWSGTIMKAELIASASVEKLEAGAQVTIVQVKGATLIVKPKE